MKTIITFGTYDLFHVGHLRLLVRARQCGNWLLVGVSTDDLNFSKKDYRPIFSQNDRRDIINGIGVVDETFFEECLELKGEYIKTFKADVLVMGDDWKGKFDQFKSLYEMVYLARTQGISTTQVREDAIKRALQ